MKNFNLYIAGLALISSVCATAQTHQALPQPVPGVKAQQLFKKANNSRPAAQRPDTKTTYALHTKGVRMVPLAQIAKAQRAEKADEMVKKTLPTSWTKTENNGTPETGKITYDKYGRFSVVDYGTYKDLYTYDTNETGSKWSKKLVRRQRGENTVDRYKEERTFDQYNRVSTIKVYENPFGTGLMLVEEREYDYSQNLKGIEVKNVDYEICGDVLQPGQVELLKWFAPTKSYISITYNALYDKVDFEVNGTNYTIKRYRKNYDNELVLTDTEERYFTADGRDLGYLNCSYSEGQISYSDGQKTELLPNTPEAGFTTEIRSQISPYLEDANTWVYNEKYVYSNNKDLPKIQANGDRSEKYYRYETSKADWDLKNVETGTWTPEGFLKETYESYDDGVLDYTETGLIKYSATGEEEGYVVPFKDGGYVLETDIPGVDGSYYTFYDKNHNVTRQLRAIYKDGKDTGFDSYESTVPEEHIYEELKNGKWVTVTTDLLIGDGDNHLEVKFNAKGQMTQWDEYENGLHTEHVVYTYLDNGYIEESYDTETNKVDEYTQVTIDAANVVTYINYEYNSSGKVRWGEKCVTYPTGKQLYYKWSSDLQDYKLVSTTVKTLTSTAADGTKTSIFRNIDDNGNVVETRKESYYDKDGAHRREVYNMVNGQWVGESKSEDEPVTVPQFEVLDLQDPTASNDEYFYPYDNDEDEDVFPSSSTNYTTWGWKDGQWAIGKQEVTVYSQPDENTLVMTYTEISDNTIYDPNLPYEKRTNYDSRKRDSRNNLIEHKYGGSTLEIYNGTTTQNRQYEIIDSYTYNDEGLLTSHKHEEYHSQEADASASAARAASAASTLQLTRSIVTNYYYTELNIVNGITSTTADATKPAFAVSGRTVSVVGKGAAISLYTLDGQCVATSATGQVEAPTHGVFVAVSGAAKCKIVVK